MRKLDQWQVMIPEVNINNIKQQMWSYLCCTCISVQFLAGSIPVQVWSLNIYVASKYQTLDIAHLGLPKYEIYNRKYNMHAFLRGLAHYQVPRKKGHFIFVDLFLFLFFNFNKSGIS